MACVQKIAAADRAVSFPSIAFEAAVHRSNGTAPVTVGGGTKRGVAATSFHVATKCPLCTLQSPVEFVPKTQAKRIMMKHQHLPLLPPVVSARAAKGILAIAVRRAVATERVVVVVVEEGSATSLAAGIPQLFPHQVASWS